MLDALINKCLINVKWPIICHCSNKLSNRCLPIYQEMGKNAKVLICGMRGVGKTSIIEQLIYGNVTADTELYPTIEDTYVASVDTGRGPREILRLYDTAGVQGAGQLPKHYMAFPDGYILIYDPSQPQSFEVLTGIKTDIDKYKDKKEVIIIVLANIHTPNVISSENPTQKANSNTNLSTNSPTNITSNSNKVQTSAMNFDAVISRAISWCNRERLRHCVVNAMERNTLYEPFVNLATKLYPPPNKSTFPLSKLTKGKSDLHT